MKKLAICFLLSILLFACNKEATVNIDTNQIALNVYHWGEKLTIDASVENADIKKQNILINGKTIEGNVLSLTKEITQLGTNTLKYTVELSNGETKEYDVSFTVLSPTKEDALGYTIIKKYPHDADNFTEGFYTFNGDIVEGTGLEGHSKLMQYTLGETVNRKEHSNDAAIFGEGIVRLGEIMYQMTYRNKIVYKYDTDFNLLEELPMPVEIKEGWGATTDGEKIFVSDGTNEIKILDKNFVYKSSISVVGNSRLYDQINELEYVDGFIWANVFMQDVILKIDASTGQVVGGIDLSDIAKKHKTNQEAVLNGIAYNEATKNLLITGKLWDTIYEISIK